VRRFPSRLRQGTGAMWFARRRPAAGQGRCAPLSRLSTDDTDDMPLIPRCRAQRREFPAETVEGAGAREGRARNQQNHQRLLNAASALFARATKANRAAASVKRRRLRKHIIASSLRLLIWSVESATLSLSKRCCRSSNLEPRREERHRNGRTSLSASYEDRSCGPGRAV
jgi:hypothetical protein